MALINCSECNHSVSDKAPVCPNCGNPIATAREVSATGTPLQTVQQTSKRLKLHIVFGTLLFLYSVISMIWWGNTSEKGEDSGYAAFVFLCFLISLIWILVTRIRIWWHHK